jgi:hypothetical protein
MSRAENEVPRTWAAGDALEAVRDWIGHWQMTRPNLSIRAIALRLGYASPAYLIGVLAGRKRVSRSLVGRLAEEIDLPPIHARLVLALVDLDKEGDPGAREALSQSIAELRLAAKPLMNEELRSRRTFLHSVIYEMMRCPDFVADPDWIADKLRVTADPLAIARALRDFPERPSLEPAVVITSKDCRLAADDPHWEAVRAWQEILPELSRTEYFRSLTTVPVSAAMFASLREEFEAFSRTVYARCEHAAPREIVAQFGLYLFQVTRPLDGGERAGSRG